MHAAALGGLSMLDVQLLVGDPRQLAAVGPGGALADIAERGIRYQLAEVRRFRRHNAWEGPASLRLRDGDADVLEEYAKHGRLVPGGTAELAVPDAGLTAVGFAAYDCL